MQTEPWGEPISPLGDGFPELNRLPPLCPTLLCRLPIAIAGRSATKLQGILNAHGAAAKSFQVLANVDINDQDSLKRMAASARQDF